MTFCAALGTFTYQPGQAIVLTTQGEHHLDSQEWFIWSSMSQAIRREEQLYQYYQMQLKMGQFQETRSYEDCLASLEEKELFARADAPAGGDALRALLGELRLIPIHWGLKIRISQFIRLLLNNIPLRTAVLALTGEKLSKNERVLLRIIKKTGMTASELIQFYQNSDKSPFSGDGQIPHIVIQSTANLYIKKKVYYEKEKPAN